VAEREGMADAARHALVHAKALYGDRVTEPVLTVRLLLAKGLAAEGQDAAALAELDDVLADTTRFLGPAYKLVEVIHNYRGHVRLDAGDVAGAIDDFRLQLAAAEGRSGNSGANRGVTHAALARALAAARRDEEALTHYETGAQLSREAIGGDNLHVWRSLSARVLVLARLGRLAEAERCIDAVDASSWTAGDVDRSIHAGRVSVLRGLQGRHEEAIALARASVDGLRTHPSKIVRATASGALGNALLAAGRAGEAVEPLREAVRLFAAKQLTLSPDQADAVKALADARVRANAIPGVPVR
jgi:tetratricopeptide (TPR) repeat protein